MFRRVSYKAWKGVAGAAVGWGKLSVGGGVGGGKGGLGRPAEKACCSKEARRSRRVDNSSCRCALRACARARRLEEEERASRDSVEAVDASERESWCRVEPGDVEGVGEGGEQAEGESPGRGIREVAVRGRGFGTAKIGATGLAAGMFIWSDAKKNCTLSFVSATRRASWRGVRTPPGGACGCVLSRRSEAVGRLSRSGALPPTWGGRVRPTRSF